MEVNIIVNFQEVG